MADTFSKEERSRVMAAIRSTGNRSTELALVRLLRAAKISGWRRDQPLSGKPDFVFRKEGVVVFVDGCFWHGCPRCAVPPKSNQQYWDDKLARNRARDVLVTRRLRANGWRVLRIWHHELKRPRRVLYRIGMMLRRNRD